MARPLPMMLTPPCQMAKVSSEPAEMEHEGTMPGTMPETMRNHAAGEKNLIELRTGFFGVKDFFGYFGQNFGIRGAEHHKRATLTQPRPQPNFLRPSFPRVADPRTLQGCGDPRTLFLKRVRGGPFFEKINTAMVRGATERRP